MEGLAPASPLLKLSGGGRGPLLLVTGVAELHPAHLACNRIDLDSRIHWRWWRFGRLRLTTLLDPLQTGAIGRGIDKFSDTVFQHERSGREKNEKDRVGNDKPKIDVGRVQLPVNQYT
jgi:hypothetical protein